MTSYTKPLTLYAKPYILIMTSHADKQTHMCGQTQNTDKTNLQFIFFTRKTTLKGSFRARKL